MASTIENTGWTIADLMHRFGPMPLTRICQSPPPGRGTKQDVLDWEARESRLFELVDTVLLEKTSGFCSRSQALLGKCGAMGNHYSQIITGNITHRFSP